MVSRFLRQKRVQLPMALEEACYLDDTQIDSIDSTSTAVQI